jgi:hypothetical protein
MEAIEATEELATEELAFDDLENASALMYAVARRFCISFEDLKPSEDGSPTLGDTASDLCAAAVHWMEAHDRWQAARPAEADEADAA